MWFSAVFTYSLALRVMLVTKTDFGLRDVVFSRSHTGLVLWASFLLGIFFVFRISAHLSVCINQVSDIGKFLTFLTCVVIKLVNAICFK